MGAKLRVPIFKKGPHLSCQGGAFASSSPLPVSYATDDYVQVCLVTVVSNACEIKGFSPNTLCNCENIIVLQLTKKHT